VTALALTPRRNVTQLMSAGALLGGLALGLAISFVLLLANGIAVSDVFAEFVAFVFLSDAGLASVAVEATPLVLAGLAGAVALKVRFWNIGIEGQLWLGAIGATGIALNDAGPDGTRLALMALAGMVAGALWIALPALLKTRLGVSEIISTLLLNYVALLLVQHLVFGAWKDPQQNFPYTAGFDTGTEQLARLGWGKTHAGLVIALAATAVVWLLAERSRWGAYMRAVGASPEVARATGVPVLATVVLAVAVSGALAGLAGFSVAAGEEHRLTQHLGVGYGFSGILIAFLARFRALGVLVAAVLVAGLYVAGDSLQQFYQLPAALIELIQAIILFSVVGADFFARYRLHRA
jgi:general nucleoside transport system permease protein